MEKQILLILVIFLWLSIITFGSHKSSGDKNIQKSSTISNEAISTSNIFYTNANGDIDTDPLVNYKLPPGLVMPFFSTAIPNGWILCDGRLLSKSEYSALYAVIGDVFASDNIFTNLFPNYFKLPDLRGKFMLGTGSGYNLGDTGGEYIHALKSSEMPSHNHSVNITEYSSSEGGTGTVSILTDNDTHDEVYALNDTGLIQINYTGDGIAHENRPPYFAANYIIFTGKN